MASRAQETPERRPILTGQLLRDRIEATGTALIEAERALNAHRLAITRIKEQMLAETRNAGDPVQPLANPLVDALAGLEKQTQKKETAVADSTRRFHDTVALWELDIRR